MNVAAGKVTYEPVAEATGPSEYIELVRGASRAARRRRP